MNEEAVCVDPYKRHRRPETTKKLFKQVSKKHTSLHVSFVSSENIQFI